MEKRYLYARGVFVQEGARWLHLPIDGYPGIFHEIFTTGKWVVIQNHPENPMVWAALPCTGSGDAWTWSLHHPGWKLFHKVELRPFPGEAEKKLFMDVFSSSLKTDISHQAIGYWNNRWPKSPIIYAGRALRGSSAQIRVDVRNFVTVNDAVLHEVIRENRLIREDLNATAWKVQQFVCSYLTYAYDEKAKDCPEFWQFPFESLASRVGDCEDGAVLMASLMIQCGIPRFRVKVAGGAVATGKNPGTGTSSLGSHAYCLFLADRKDSVRGMEWEVHDWTFHADPEIPTGKKPLAKHGGRENRYRDVWFTFNNIYSWIPRRLEIEEKRITAFQAPQDIPAWE